tara:strand:- start:261 stop:1091 length:831 start_codon:yes stop_codon:yes gene_type:complete
LKKKNNLIQLSSKDTTVDAFKNNIFDGKILLIKNSKEIYKIIELVEYYFYYFFNSEITNSEKQKINYNKENPIFFEIIQNRIKFCKLIRKYFANFLLHIGLDIQDTFMDYITFRYSPATGMKNIGTLIPTAAHRDTWASNIFNQINFWFPIHNVSDRNSIFFVPNYFKKRVSNNSDEWSFYHYKKTKKFLSTPVSYIKFPKNEIVSFNVKKGEVLCFSGHHIHGSLVGENDRLNLETRIVCDNDEETYKIPVNLDAMGNIRKNKWFKNLKTGKSYI